MSSCGVRLDELLDYRESRLSPERQAWIAVHLDSGCRVCVVQTEWIDAFMPEFRRVLDEPEPCPSPRALAFAYGLARLIRPAESARVATLVQIARRFLDAPRLVPARDAASCANRQLYETDTHLIDLWDEIDLDGSHYVMGQAQRRGEGAAPPIQVEAMNLSGAPPLRGAILGTEFHFEAVPAGVYHLRVVLEGTEILLPGVQFEG